MPDSSSLDVRPGQLAVVRDILQKHVPGLAVWAFGSRVIGGAKQFSDLDLVVVAETPLTLERLAALAEAFSESDLPWKVDVVDWASIDENFRRVIKERYVVIQEGQGE